MAQIQLSKSQLAREKETLVSLKRYLPSLDLKRQQLMGERNRARRELVQTREAFKAMVDTVGADLPMLADRRIDLKGLARFESVALGTRNVAGVKVPVVESVEVVVPDYGQLVRPHWVDAVAGRLREAVRLRLELDVAEKRIEALETAVRRVTQRVNLFDKVLVPQALENIKRINIHLGDAERAAVVAAKISKRKREMATAAATAAANAAATDAARQAEASA